MQLSPFQRDLRSSICTQSRSTRRSSGKPIGTSASCHRHGHDMIPYILVFCAFLALLPVNSGQLSQPVLDGHAGVHDAEEQARVYIVHVRKPEHMLSASHEEVEEWHKSFLPSPALDSGEPRLVFSYKVVISGFAARLTAEEVGAMGAKEGFLYAQPDEELTPETTHSPDFLGLRRNVWPAANRGRGCIIGVVDTGIDHEHASFVANQIPDPPGWNGWCYFDDQRTCNGKLIGAKYPVSNNDVRPPVDGHGHGTHVAGIAAGLEIQQANIYGYAEGVAAGAAPDAYLAMYGAPNGGAEILRSIEHAIQDGVHIISISMGRGGKVPFYQSAIAKGALAAVRRGILVSASAGNRGPDWCTVGNDAPWLVTVGASTMGRALRWTLTVHNGAGDTLIIPGESLHGHRIEGDIVYPGANGGAARRCTNLNGVDVDKKVVMCYTSQDVGVGFQAGVVRKAGGAAIVLMNSNVRGSIITDVPDVGILPVVAINHGDSLQLVAHVRGNPPPRAELVPVGTLTGVAPFPAVPYFSSRGPSLANGGILKPDILGPGVNILSARLNSRTGFILKSGTSMATPHVSGVAAILKQHLPTETRLDWTPAMIRSTVITTAEGSNRQRGAITDETDEPADMFAKGAGLVNPAAAMDPGLVYDITFNDYVRYLCGLGYSDNNVYVTAQVNVNCSDPQWRMDPEQLNYPSITVTLSSGATTKTVGRTATHVWRDPATYRAEVILDAGDDDGDGGENTVDVRVTPDTLHFAAPGDTRSFQVTISLSDDDEGNNQSGHIGGKLRWVSDKHTVTSPLHITFGDIQTEVYRC